MTAKEKLLRDVLDLDEAKAARARIVVADEAGDEPEMAPLPKGWGETLTGEPMPNVAAAVRRSRESH
jgi:molybdopterin biosynthesis enzyme